jgi:hypothetical protein
MLPQYALYIIYIIGLVRGEGPTSSPSDKFGDCGESGAYELGFVWGCRRGVGVWIVAAIGLVCRLVGPLVWANGQAGVFGLFRGKWAGDLWVWCFWGQRVLLGYGCGWGGLTLGLGSGSEVLDDFSMALGANLAFR